MQRTGSATLAGLICIGLFSAGFAVARGGGGGAGRGVGAHGSGNAHHGHRGRGLQGNRGFAGGWFPDTLHGGWVIPGYGFYFASLPSYCKRIYWEGVPYFNADDVYYEWNASVGAYEEVHPPAGLADEVDARAPVRELFVFPVGGQTNEQLARDREACHRWAVEQAGFDPQAAAGSKARDHTAAKDAQYLRAEAACLEARGYGVE